MIGIIKHLKKTHPQKYYFKICFAILYYTGAGYNWYEGDGPSTKISKLFYKLYFIIINVYMFGGFFNEYGAYFRFNELTVTERDALYLHSLGHTCIMSKIFLLYVQKEKIKALLRRFLETNREYSSLELENRSLKKARLGCFTIVMGTYATLVLSMFSAVISHIKEGTPIYTEVTYYPHWDTYYYLRIALRILIEIHWYYIITVMNAIDSICVFTLIFLSYKFIYLQKFFANLKRKLDRKDESKEVLEEEFFREFVVGIKLHEDALWCAQNIQSTLGVVYSIQVIECIVCVVICLLKMVASTDVAMFAANFMFMICVSLLTAVYMVPGGDVTYEAGEVSTWIMFCGWDNVRALRRLRPLAVMAMMRSQRPVIMTAFGIINLSYSNLVNLLRSSYSFFAVMR